MKFQISNSKPRSSIIPSPFPSHKGRGNKKENSLPPPQADEEGKGVGSLKFGDWSLFGAWCLVLGVFFSIVLIPLPAEAVTFINCGSETRDANNQITGVDQCDFNDLLVTIVTVINYLVSVAAVVAMYHILLSGFNLITSVGNAEKIQKAKGSISNAVVGFAAIILGFVFVNLLVNGLFGKAEAQRPWWDLNCVYNITGDYPGCPLSTTSTSTVPPGGTSGDSCSDPATLAGQHSNARFPTGNDPALDSLISCVNSRIGSMIDQGQIYTYERSPVECNYTRNDGHCGLTCEHVPNSCHYGGASGTTGARAVDFNAAAGVTEQQLYNELQKFSAACGFGQIIFETNHTHVNLPSCTGT